MARRKAKPARGLPELTPLELELMRVIWERGNATAAEVRQALAARHDFADTTVHTVLANLRNKGYIEPIPTIERALRFAPCVKREQVGTRSLKQVLKTYFDGSPQRLMAHLIKENTVDENELAAIRKMLRDDGEKGGKKK